MLCKVRGTALPVKDSVVNWVMGPVCSKCAPTLHAPSFSVSAAHPCHNRGLFFNLNPEMRKLAGPSSLRGHQQEINGEFLLQQKVTSTSDHR